MLLSIATDCEGEAQLQAVKNLMNLAASMDLKTTIVAKGAITAMLRVMDSNPSDEKKLLVLKVFMNLISHKDTKVPMVHAGVVEALLALCSQV